jgi:hypothetical protein
MESLEVPSYVFKRGKYGGMSIEQVPKDFLEWLLTNSKGAEPFLKLVHEELRRRRSAALTWDELETRIKGL